jgi:hypothetical protein
MVLKSLWGDDQYFSGPLMRFARGDMRDDIVSHKTTTDLCSAATEPCSGKNVLKSTSRDFRKSSIFDFCNTICQKQKLRDYSITSSARASSAGGMMTPSVIAVFKLITSSNLVGCSTGSSAGFAPFGAKADIHSLPVRWTFSPKKRTLAPGLCQFVTLSLAGEGKPSKVVASSAL